MKSHTKERGSIVHIVVIIILVLAVLGLLGFVFWNNFLHKTTTSNSASTTTQSTTSDTTKSSKTLTIREWSVKGSYVSTSTYGYAIDKYGMLQLTDPMLSSFCNSTIGYIQRATANEIPALSTGDPRTAKEVYDGQTDKKGVANVGDYYYFTEHPQSNCDTDAETAIQADTTAAELSILASLTQE